MPRFLVGVRHILRDAAACESAPAVAETSVQASATMCPQIVGSGRVRRVCARSLLQVCRELRTRGLTVEREGCGTAARSPHASCAFRTSGPTCATRHEGGRGLTLPVRRTKVKLVFKKRCGADEIPSPHFFTSPCSSRAASSTPLTASEGCPSSRVSSGPAPTARPSPAWRLGRVSSSHRGDVCDVPHTAHLLRPSPLRGAAVVRVRIVQPRVALFDAEKDEVVASVIPGLTFHPPCSSPSPPSLQSASRA
jgi:hypothetical protein